MARKKKVNPYEGSAGRGTGDYLASPTSTAIETVSMPASTLKAGRKAVRPPPPDSSMLGAVLATFFCFWPLGVIAIIWALRVRPRWKRGDEDGARHAAEMAEKFTFAAVGLFVILFAIGIVVYAIYWFTGPRTKP